VRLLAVGVALLISIVAALALAQPARAATQPADIDFISVDPGTEPGHGVYNFNIAYPGAEVPPFTQGSVQGHCVELSQSAGDGPSTLASGPDMSFSGPGGTTLGAADQDRLLWILLSSRATQLQPSPGLTTAQEGAAHQTAIWSITDTGDPGVLPADAAAAARGTALASASSAGVGVAGQAATFTAVGQETCSGTARQVTVSGAPHTSATLTIVSGTGSFANGSSSIAVALGADGTATLPVNGAAGAVAIEALVQTAELVQVQKVNGGPAGQDFAFARVTPATIRLDVKFRNCTTTKTSTTSEKRTTRRANLRVSKAGPRRVRAGRTANYVIRIRNTSKTTARNLIINDRLPRGLVLARRPANSKLRGRTVQWRVKRLAPGRTITRRVRVRVLNSVEGRRCNRATVVARNATRRTTRRCTRVVALPKRPVLPSVTG
jgi:uncharacterized repeat protein (TIGR01451 family)